MRKKILIIDDEEDFCFFTKKNLENTKKFDVIFENNPLNGVKVAIQNKPDIILLDIIMPELDGSEVAFRLLNDPSTKDIPILFLTCLADEKDLSNNKGSIGGRPFLAKPCEVNQLVKTIQEILERKV